MCEMHKRKDAFLLKGRGEMKFRWCFYSSSAEDRRVFTESSRSICTEKFALEARKAQGEVRISE